MSASTDLDVEQVRQSLSIGSIGFGAVAVATPGLFTTFYGLKGDGNLRAMVQLWGTRNLVLGAIGLMTEDPAQRKTLATLSAALNVADTVIVARGGSDVALRARVGGALTTAAFAAAAAYVATNL
ncbi:hypothetical protein H5V45_19710 [Nocardioides sp. KIGAM211]|uniref:DUF4267 domain-containing protein n=1 Tax=Nocardioides luti TaxID=2761101 RepID=A0A7X0RJQ9_9ACTN|nr:DUF4267 domain-containing protein [Nocardioides luti]MBB6629557.1 hypothetical protein [Nocardioides luti]